MKCINKFSEKGTERLRAYLSEYAKNQEAVELYFDAWEKETFDRLSDKFGAGSSLHYELAGSDSKSGNPVLLDFDLEDFEFYEEEE